MDKQKRIKELVSTLNSASESYYAQDIELMSNYEYDRLYDELVELEEETGLVMANSPTVRVGYDSVDSLPKEKHEKPMLSLGKTKDRAELRDWLNGHEALLSWKLDGLTVVLTYNEGNLAKAVTRGNGEIGEIVTNNARTFMNIPLKIPYQGELVLRGEAVISYSDFELINNEIPDETLKYKNPRNLCSGAVRQLDPSVTAKRKVKFYAFSLVSASGVEFYDSREKELEFLSSQGFEVVDYIRVSEANIFDAIETYEKKIEGYDIPSDGLVLLLDEISYGVSLGMTAKYPRNAIAFKWTDETMETKLKYIEWSPSRTGLINPVAVFEPVELEGTTVSRASVHNISYVKNLKLGIGDSILVYKANMIIPQIADNLTKSDNIEIPSICPICGKETLLRENEGTSYLFCSNENCPAKQIGSFVQFVSRNALNIEGLSESTLEKFIGQGFIKDPSDLYHLDRFTEEIIMMDGFGEKSYQNLLTAINNSRETTLSRLIYALGIENVGVSTAKLICKYFKDDIESIMVADIEELSLIGGVGEVIATSIYEYFHEPQNIELIRKLCQELHIVVEDLGDSDLALEGLSFVVTGTLINYSSRDELKTVIEKMGGKVTGTVTGKTECLINNDATSSSSKNKKAKELGVKVLTEDEFISEYLNK